MKFIVEPQKDLFVNYCFCPTLFSFFWSSNSCQQVSVGTCGSVCHSDCAAVGAGPQQPPHNPAGDDGQGGMFGPN